MEFKIGDLVRLKSGSSLMTVEEVEGSDVYCVWAESVKGKQEILRNRFNEVTIEKSQKPQAGAFAVGRR